MENMALEQQTARVVMLTIKEAAELVEGLSPYRVRQMCLTKEIPYIRAGKKFLINKAVFLNYLNGK